MGETYSDKSTETTSFLLPPGCRFYPSEEQLLYYYLTNKNLNSDRDGDLYGYNLIKELDLYDFEPYELPQRACFAYGCGGRKRHWYCYNKIRALKESSISRRTKNGYWRRRGRVREVVISNCKEGKVILGTRTSFVFYKENLSNNAVRTDWVMREYSLADHDKASFVLCRVFIKSRGGNNTSEIGLSSVAEDSVPAHVSVQATGNRDNSVDRANDPSRYPIRLVSELDNNGAPETVLPSFQFDQDVPPDEQISVSEPIGSGMVAEGVTADELLSILEGDFIELDDLNH